MKRLYEKGKLTFAIVCIVVYSILQSLANPCNKIIGIESSANAVFNLVLTAVFFCFIRKNGLSAYYGFCKTSVPAQKFLWYIPLFVLATHNLWNGFAVNLSFTDTVSYLCYMLCVTFGLWHLLHLLNGSGMELVANLCQVAGAIALGFLFVTLFYRGGSLIPCIITHSAIDAVSAFANEAGLTAQRRIMFRLLQLLIVLGYTFFLTRALPQSNLRPPKPPQSAEAPVSV